MRGKISPRISAKAEFWPFSVNAPEGHRDGIRPGKVCSGCGSRSAAGSACPAARHHRPRRGRDPTQGYGHPQPGGPSIATQNQNDSTLGLIPRPEGSPDLVPELAKILKGHEILSGGRGGRCA
jgi:hypothetical protein